MGAGIKKITYLFFVFLYGFSLLVKNNYTTSSVFVKHYLADLLAIPIILLITVVIISKIRKTANLKLSLSHVLAATAYVSIVFEFILPALNEKYTKDYLDIVCYFVGMCLYLLIEQIPLRFRETV